MRWLALAPLVALAVACGGDPAADDDAVDSDTDTTPAVAGVYEVTLDEAALDCGAYTDVAFPIPYLQVLPVEDTIEVRVCRTPEDCDAFAAEDHVLEPVEKGWKGFVTWAYWNADSEACLLQARRTTLKQPTPDTIELEGIGAYGQASPPDVPNPDDADCETLLADWTPSFSSDTQECWRREATRVE